MSDPATLGSVIAEALEISFDGLRDSMKVGLDNLGSKFEAGPSNLNEGLSSDEEPEGSELCEAEENENEPAHKKNKTKMMPIGRENNLLTSSQRAYNSPNTSDPHFTRTSLPS